MSKALETSIAENARVYAFLKIVFATEPSTELLKGLQTPEILESLESTGVSLRADDLNQSQLPNLQEDYAQLFIGPGKHISLNESIYTERTPQFWGKSTVSINKLINYVGLKLDDQWARMPDHISVEFEIMQKLLEAKDDALKNNDLSTAEQCSSTMNHLYNEHIIKWVPQVCDQVVQKAQTSVYRAIGMWTKVFIKNT